MGNLSIYTLSNAGGVQYVGQTGNPAVRQARHAATKPDLIFEVVQTVPTRVLQSMYGSATKAICQLEQAWIQRLRPPMNRAVFAPKWDGCSRFAESA